MNNTVEKLYLLFGSPIIKSGLTIFNSIQGYDVIESHVVATPADIINVMHRDVRNLSDIVGTTTYKFTIEGTDEEWYLSRNFIACKEDHSSRIVVRAFFVYKVILVNNIEDFITFKELLYNFNTIRLTSDIIYLCTPESNTRINNSYTLSDIDKTVKLPLLL